MLDGKPDNTSELVDRMNSSSSTYEEYLDAKAEKDRRCEEHADFVRKCRQKQINAYLSQKFINDLKFVSSNNLGNFDYIPDDPKPSSEKENSTPKGHRKRKNDQPVKIETLSTFQS